MYGCASGFRADTRVGRCGNNVQLSVDLLQHQQAGWDRRPELVTGQDRSAAHLASLLRWHTKSVSFLGTASTGKHLQQISTFASF